MQKENHPKKKGVVFYNNMFAQNTYEIHRYDVGSYCTRQEIIKSIRHTSGTVLEIGTGISTLLEDLPNFEKFGIDITPDSIKRAQQICKEQHVTATLQVANATKLSFPNAFFDVIVSSHVLEHIKDDAAVLQECARVLKPGDYVIMTGWTSLIMCMLFLFATKFFFLGLLGLYIGKSFQDDKQRPSFIVDELVNF